ncbi:MAG: DNRLRE domain-containing protein, partial [Chloroflexota bacterium]
MVIGLIAGRATWAEGLVAGLPTTTGDTPRLHEVRLTYRVDRSRVPAWVADRKVTLVVSVGPALDVIAQGDGRPAPCLYDGERALVTTDAAEVEVIVSAPSRPLADLGGVSIAPLRDDKPWALSLTLDDGYVSQATTAKELLDRYGYDASVAVIGGRIGIPFNGDTYASAAQLRALVDDGWYLANHSQGHYHAYELGSTSAILSDIRAANASIKRALPDHNLLMFTAPFGEAELANVAKANVNELGLRLLQITGFEARRVDVGTWKVNGDWTTTVGRTQLLKNGSQFDQVHTWLASQPGSRWWLSLHSHDVAPACDCVETAIDTLYHTYGPAGADDVWVAPAPEVYQYLIVRDQASVAETGRRVVGAASTAFRLPTPAPTPVAQRLALQEGVNGYSGTRDATLDALASQTNRGNDAGLGARTQNQIVSVIAYDVTLVPPEAVVDRAVLKLYGLSETNAAEICLEGHVLKRAWDEGAVSWERATASARWQEPGATGTDDREAGHVGLRGLVNGPNRWYTVDLTAAVRAWVARPASNHGVIMLAVGDVSKGIAMASSEYPDPARHPILEITYHLPTSETIPAPRGNALLVGNVLMPGRSEPPSAQWSLPVTVTLFDHGSSRPMYRKALTTGELGQFMLESLAPGRYDVALEAAYSLPVWRPDVNLAAGLNMLAFGPLVMGDAVQDGYITARDWTTLRAAFDATRGDPAYNPAADLNEDGAVDIFDMAIIHSNYGRYGRVLQAGSDPVVPRAISWLAPTSAQVKAGAAITLSVMLDTGGYAVNGVDLPIAYDRSYLRLTRAAPSVILPNMLPGTDLAASASPLRYVAGNLTAPVSGTLKL